MDQKNDFRTPRDRITGEFLSELFLEDSAVGAGARCASGLCGSDSTPVKKSRCRCTPADSDGRKDVRLEGDFSLVMAYVGRQSFDRLFSEEVGFREGTIFSDLHFPFYPTPCRREVEYYEK